MKKIKVNKRERRVWRKSRRKDSGESRKIGNSWVEKEVRKNKCHREVCSFNSTGGEEKTIWKEGRSKEKGFFSLKKGNNRKHKQDRERIKN